MRTVQDHQKPRAGPCRTIAVRGRVNVKLRMKRGDPFTRFSYHISSEVVEQAINARVALSATPPAATHQTRGGRRCVCSCGGLAP